MEAAAEQEVRLLQQQVIGIQAQDGGVQRRGRGGLAVTEPLEGETGAVQDFCEQGLGDSRLLKGLQRFRRRHPRCLGKDGTHFLGRNGLDQPDGRPDARTQRECNGQRNK